MKNGEYRVFLSIAALFIALGVFLGGYMLYQKYQIEKPIEAQILSISASKKVDIEKIDRSYKIEVEIDKVDNIQKVYGEVNSAISSKLGDGNYDLKIIDGRSESLEIFYTYLQPAIYEALANKRFMWLDEEINKETAKEEMSYRIFIDEENLYIQIEDGSNYLYEVINYVQGEEV